MILEPISPQHIQVNFDVVKIQVLPLIQGNENVIGKVYFKMRFSFEDCSIEVGNECFLRTFNLENFKPIDQLSKDDIIQFIIAENGGENWVEAMKSHFSRQLTDQKFQSQMVDHPLPQN